MGYLIVRNEDTAKIHLSEISSIIFDTTAVYASAYLLAELAKLKIPVIVCDERHNPIGEYLPLYGAHNTSKRIAEQIQWSEPAKKRVWQSVVREKIRQQMYVLEELGLAQSRTLSRYIEDVRSGDTTNCEAHAARVYFNALFGDEFSRGGSDARNGLLNYGYAILLSLVNREVVARGYITQIGIFHHNEYNQFNLACDFMEPFRPIVDRLVVETSSQELSPDIRRMMLDITNQTVSYQDGSYKLCSVVSQYIQDCLNALAKRISYDEIAEFSLCG